MHFHHESMLTLNDSFNAGFYVTLSHCGSLVARVGIRVSTDQNKFLKCALPEHSCVRPVELQILIRLF